MLSRGSNGSLFLIGGVSMKDVVSEPLWNGNGERHAVSDDFK